MSDFWEDECNFDFDDKINEEIWRNSPTFQKEFGVDLSVGAQQAMIEEDDRNIVPFGVLPWVPDILGAKWKSSKSIHVVGEAYAPFISEYSQYGRKKTMTLSDYAEADLNKFQKVFLEKVVNNDQNYYEPIARLVEDFIHPSQLSCFDLCRVSFVQRRYKNGRRSDKVSISEKPELELYDKYVNQGSNWSWNRLDSSKTKIIIALGWRAEHGLLRLLKSKRMRILHTKDQTQPKFPAKWMNSYAHNNYQLGSWIKGGGSWWEAQENEGHGSIRFKILPVYHPSSYNRVNPRTGKKNDENYKGAKRTLKKIITQR
ncbi:hypothetical protein BMS3Bbin16_00549 [archaeon BMS3Bbin16]|nr:hypothetical protein BMS3Bbin16_00549 [archaeon BMS3Bbin16]